MTRFVQSEDRIQGVLLPEYLDDYVAEDNRVRVIDVLSWMPAKDPVLGDKQSCDALDLAPGDCALRRWRIQYADGRISDRGAS